MIDDSLKSTLRIRGGTPPYGTVSLAGDSDATVFLLAQSFFRENKFTLKNVPRSGLVLDFISVIESLGVQLTWNNESSLTVFVPSEVSTDISSADFSYKFVQLLIPAILFRKGECEIPITFRSEAKFYRSIGFDVEAESQSILIRRNFVKQYDNEKEIKANGEELYLVAARLLLSNFEQNIKVTINTSDYRLNLIKENSSANNMVVPYNQREFNLFVSLACIPSSEINIENYDLSESLQFLMLFDKMIGNYEVMDGKLKVWSQNKPLEDLYEFKSLSCDSIGYLFLILSLVSKKTITIVCPNHKEIEDIVTELNIVGCKISYKEQGENIVAMVRPIGSLSSVRTEISDPEWGGVLILGAVASRGSSRLDNFNTLAYGTQYLLDNLSNLNLDVSV